MITIQTLIVVALSSEWRILRQCYRFTQPLSDLPLFIYHTKDNACANAKNNDFKVAVLQIGMGSEKAKSTLQQFFKTHLAEKGRESAQACMKITALFAQLQPKP